MDAAVKLAQLRDRFASGELEGCALMLDNDSTNVCKDDEDIFEMHPDELLEAALDLLGIPHEHV
jgi:hypothetical protein